MFELFQSIRWTHIAFGSLALALFWIPVAARKGGRLHVRIGWAYVVCMSVVVLTAFTMSGMAFAFPLGVRHIERAMTPGANGSVHSGRLASWPSSWRIWEA